MEYGKEARTLTYEVQEKIGELPSLEVCASEIAKHTLGKCKTAVYMDVVLVDSMRMFNYWLLTLLIGGLISFLIGASIYIRAILSERKKPLKVIFELIKRHC